MPLFEYQCKQCKHEFEFLQQTGEPNPETCPQCGSIEPQRKMSTFTPSCASPGGSPPASAPTPCATGSCPYVQ
ncbi:MAG: FmdB family transcriptional regulator [Acidobacteria bacterium]|nr:MAG: FmdB family transcriptional regulator [Acidobacteriota bacterium]PIE89698.1 MAG: FmdB family transcriptional regulator [Acidobacteriota bacterium]